MTGTWWAGTWLVAQRNITDNLRSRAFTVVTVLLLLVSVGAVVVPGLLSRSDTGWTLATTGSTPAVVAAVQDAARATGTELEHVALAGGAQVRRAVQEGDADAGLAGGTLYVRADSGGALAALVSQAVVAVDVGQRLLAAGLSPEQVAQVQSVRAPEQVPLSGVQDTGRAAAGFLVGIVLYLAVTFAGSTIATAVATEKGTRISEVLLAVLRPSQIMVGTVLAVGLVTFGQVLLLATPVAVAARWGGTIGLPAVAGADIALGIVWFVLGFVLYSFAFAAAGALVDKVTDVSATVTPVTLVLVAGYMVGVLAATSDSEGAVSVVASLFPVSAPLVMPIRWAGGQVPPVQLVLSMAGTAVTAALLAALAATVYRRALLITGRRARLREVVHLRAAA
ncbi:ABC transporter permease [uncultured Cellulomonas sp.]|uniref:ABC transporter permease n=1 Tax=uncultured Cellulomonas sp. TaxID=189682 RepID=UPI00260536C7|nr:ABC transporter permease [uncultured Cellulomonas sp.]